MTWQQRLNQEKSLFQIYKIARIVAFSKGNVVAAVCIFLMSVMLLGVNAFTGMAVASMPALQKAINSVADTGFAFTSTMLGFLISGFAIFASISKPDVLIILAKTDYKNPRISELQFIFFNFILVFIHYIIFVGACAFIKIISGDSGPLPKGLDLASTYSDAIGCALTSTLLAVLLSWLAFVTLLLKSFIWNLYQSVLITIQIEDLLKQTQSGGDGD
ncbi:hypothetical protein HFN51_27775 [Rhizobium leguminosarum]|nr:hypothetical protein [Rhizobium leguminosarum]